MSLKSGHRIIPVIGEESQKQNEEFHGNRVGTIRLQPDGWFLTLPFIDNGGRLYDFKFKPSDVVIMTYPKCGTTWTQEIVWTMLHNPDLDNPKANLLIHIRSPFLELDYLFAASPKKVLVPGNSFYDSFVEMYPERNPENGLFLQLAEFAENPRIIKTHLPFSLLSPSLLDTCKVIYVARNPKDVAVSYCHHSRLFKGHGFQGDISGFVDHFLDDTLLCSPFWTHLKEAWRKRDHPNLHYIFYENMKTNPRDAVMQIKNFLGVNLTENQIDNIVNHTSFEAMKTRDAMLPESDFEAMSNVEVLKKDGGFFRKGVAGDWKTKLTAEDIERIDKWTKKNVEEIDGDFKYKG